LDIFGIQEMVSDPNKRSTEIKLDGRGRGFTDITPQISDWVAGTGIENGLVSVFVRHTSASLIIQENADPDILLDLEDFFSRLVPDADAGGKYRHSQEGPDDMPAHIRSALTLSQISVPVLDGRLGLGTWQSIYLYEHRALARPRKIVLQVLET
jgi:secondary thiamine-phosphate synthase enzyme